MGKRKEGPDRDEMLADPSHFAHGTESGYSYWRCRCERCRKAWATAHAAHRDDARSAPVPRRHHGTRYGYTYYACRCFPCRQAQSDYSKARADGR